MSKGIYLQYADEMLAFMHKHKTLTRQELTEMLNQHFGTNFTRNQISSKCIHIGALTGRTGRLEKGHSSWNKGMKGFKPSPETMWKKGNIPKNARPVGFERVNRDGHIEIKVEGERQMVLKHRWVWEQHNGKIPDGYVITFRDGNQKNCNIENLMMMSRAELVIYNKQLRKMATSETNETCLILARLKAKSSQALRGAA